MLGLKLNHVSKSGYRYLPEDINVEIKLTGEKSMEKFLHVEPCGEFTKLWIATRLLSNEENRVT